MHSLFEQFKISDGPVQELMDSFCDRIVESITYRECDNGDIEIDVPGFNKEHLTVTSSHDTLDVNLQNDVREESMAFSVVIPDHTESVKCTIVDGIMRVSFTVKPDNLDILIE